MTDAWDHAVDAMGGTYRPTGFLIPNSDKALAFLEAIEHTCGDGVRLGKIGQPHRADCPGCAADTILNLRGDR